MTLPTSTYVRTYDVGKTKRVIIHGSRQRKPYNLPLPYFKQVYIDRVAFGSFSAIPPYEYPTRAWAINRSYARFINELGERAENATNVIQYKQALSMIENRGMQLFRFTRALRRGRVAEAASIIGYTPTLAGRSKFKRRSREFGGLWLEYAYGIAPLVQDIYTSLDVLQRPLPTFRVKSKATESATRITPGSFVYTDVFVTRCSHRAYVGVQNPNLWLANQMGLVNPGSWVWEAVPFSFVVDWFANVGQVIASLTDLAGLSLTHPHTTIVSRAHEKKVYGGYLLIYDRDGHFVERSMGIITPSLGVRPFKGFSVARAANAISLLLVQLRG